MRAFSRGSVNPLTDKKMVIVSHTPHYKKDGVVVGWSPTVREINFLAKHFREIIHIAPLHEEEAPDNALPYECNNIRFESVCPSGGTSLKDKISILFQIPCYIKTILHELKSADAVHVRCPAGISLLTIILLKFIKFPQIRWVKYAGNWQRYENEALSYKFQKWWLRNNFSRSKVTVNGEWSNQPAHIHSFYNPCLSEQERMEAIQFAADKQLSAPFRFIFVGRLEEEKGVGRILKLAKQLDDNGISYELSFVGDGPMRKDYEKEAKKIKGKVFFCGWLSRAALNLIYAKSHFILLPSQGEGWPKVLSEAMAYGSVPVASKISCIPDYLHQFQTGKTFCLKGETSFKDAVLYYRDNPEAWKRESLAAVQASKFFTYENYLKAVRELMEAYV